ncbi:MAG TPA: RNA polymerase sigma factor [Solirubrobacteraceae bacterium]|nr:RNA polymerase sigma factor [Solirubrobacteraceae bacterium]
MRAAQRGDAAALEALFTAFWPQCHRAAWLITRDHSAAEDIAQEGFLAAVAALDRFDRSRRLGPWLHTIVARRAIDYARARTVRREVRDGPADSGPSADEPQTSGPSADLLDALAGLHHERRVVVVLRHLLDLSPRQIAEILDVPVGTVNSRMRRALDQLRTDIERDDG